MFGVGVGGSYSIGDLGMGGRDTLRERHGRSPILIVISTLVQIIVIMIIIIIHVIHVYINIYIYIYIIIIIIIIIIYIYMYVCIRNSYQSPPSASFSHLPPGLRGLAGDSTWHQINYK